MKMAIEKMVWRDEELASVMVAGKEDYAPRYDIVDRGGRVVAEGARINLINGVTVAGTPHNAENMNELLQKCDAQGSFFYRPLADAPLYRFAHAAQASSWAALPPCPVDMGTNPVCFMHGGKWHVTLGYLAEYNGLTYNIAVFDPDAMTWDVRTHGGYRPVNLGGIEDFGVFGNRLFVAGKDWDNARPAMAWLDSLNLEDLTWTKGSTVTWPADVLTIGPIALADEGTRPVVLSRNGVGSMGNLVDRFTATATAPQPQGVLPNINGVLPPVPAGVVRFGNTHVMTMPNRTMHHSANTLVWTNIAAHPAIANGHLLPVGADENHAVFVATQGGNSFFYRMDREFGVTNHNMSRALNQRVVVRGGSRYYHMRSGQASVWEPTVNWAVFDAATGATTFLPPAPEVLTDYGLAATDSHLFAIKGNVAYLGHFGTVDRGIVLGAGFKGLSVSATRDVFLVNHSRTIVAEAGAWHKLDDDYLICTVPEVTVFGQVVNI